MRARMLALAAFAALNGPLASAHGPQIQITNDNDKITTRQLLKDGPYSTALTAPKSVYVMPMAEFNGVWTSRPNDEIDPILMQPAFPSGPGLAYGHDQADRGPRAFEADGILSVTFIDGLKLWNGVTFADAGISELKGFRGSDPTISSPAANFAVTSDTGPFDSLSLAAISAPYNAEAHSSLRWALLGDGTSPTSASPDGVYLVKLEVSSTQVGLASSDPYYFVLHKNAAPGEVAAAVGSLGVAPSLVQVVPEPTTLALVGLGATVFVGARSGARGRKQR